jgi:hypothetical protein
VRWSERQTSDQLRIVDRWTHVVGFALILGSWWLEQGWSRVWMNVMGIVLMLVSLACWVERRRVLKEEQDMAGGNEGEVG